MPNAMAGKALPASAAPAAPVLARSVSEAETGDREVLAQVDRRLRHEAKHLMMRADMRVETPMEGFEEEDKDPNPELTAMKEEIIKGREEEQDRLEAMYCDLDEPDVEVKKGMAEYAKQQILNATSNSEMLLRAEMLIDEDELGYVDALPGNIYTIAAFGDFEGKKNLETLSRFLGFVLVCLVQVIGPIMILLSTLIGEPFIYKEDGLNYRWRCWSFSSWAGHEPISVADCMAQFEENLPNSTYQALLKQESVPPHFDWEYIWLTKILGIIFMAVFILNGLFVLLDESRTWKNIYNTFRFLKHNTPNFQVKGEGFLLLGAFVNCWVVSICCLDVYLVVGASRTPSDLLLDALGLLFLYNLDDIGGDLGFVDEDDWPGLRLAWIYDTLVKNKPGDEESLKWDENALDRTGKLVMGLFNTLAALMLLALFVLPALSCVTPFLVISPNN